MPIQPAVLLSLSLLLFSCAAPTSVSDTPRPAIVLSGSEGDQIPFPIHPTRRLASSAASESGLSVFELTVPPHSAGAPPHTHMYEDEFFYVRKGSPTFMAGGVRRTVDAGGFVLLPRNGAHAFWNDSDEEAILLAGTSNGKFDDFFDAVALEVRVTGAKSPKDVGEILGRVGAARGIRIHMDMLPADVATLYGLPAD